MRPTYSCIDDHKGIVLGTSHPENESHKSLFSSQSHSCKSIEIEIAYDRLHSRSKSSNRLYECAR